MATVPGILWIGAFHATGGNPGLFAVADGIMQTRLSNLLDREVMRIVPDDPSTGAPTAGSLSCWPWFDPAADSTSYTITASTTTTITVAGTPWTTNQWAGRLCTVRNATPLPNVGFADRFVITSNTSNTLTFSARPAAPTVGATFFLGVGMFLDYHPVAGWLHPTEVGSPSLRSGSTPYSVGNGVGPDAGFVRRVFQGLYSSAPYFHFWKWQTTTAVTLGWADAPNDGQRANLLAEKARVDAAAAARGNTISWQWVVIDLSMTDLEAAIGNPLLALVYEARLQQMIAWLRSAFSNADLRIVLIQHRQDLWSASAPGGALFFRGLQRSVARQDGLVSLYDMEGARIATATDAPGDEPKYYTQDEYIRMGIGVCDLMVRTQNPVPVPAPGGFPLYLMLGDSIFVGHAVADWILKSESRDISGPTPGSLLRPTNQRIWSDVGAVLETYHPTVNSNQFGSISATAGPDLSIMAELGRIHPDGFAVLKRASNGSTMYASGIAYDPGTGNGGRWAKAFAEHYSMLRAAFGRCVAYINSQGRQADVRGAFVSLGTNDQVVAGGGQTFADQLRGFLADLWLDFSTRTSGEKFPIIWRRPQAEFNGAQPAQLEIVRQALADVAEEDPQFVPVDADDLERDRNDNLHETPESAVLTGRRMVAALRTVAI
jgi:hypothetical protein